MHQILLQQDEGYSQIFASQDLWQITKHIYEKKIHYLAVIVIAILLSEGLIQTWLCSSN